VLAGRLFIPTLVKAILSIAVVEENLQVRDGVSFRKIIGAT